MEELRQRYLALKSIEDTKDALIEDLLAVVLKLTAERDALRQQLRGHMSATLAETPHTNHTSTRNVEHSHVSPTVSDPDDVRNVGDVSSVWRVLKNKDGQRLDMAISTVDEALLSQIKSREPPLCIRHHLNDDCPHVECGNDHDSKLDLEQLDALRCFARSTPCRSGKCVYGKCLAGHRCPREAGCDGAGCNFPAVMHIVDTKIDYSKSIPVS